MRRLLKVLLSLNNLRKALGFTTFFRATKNNYQITLVNDLKVNSVLVLAPHPDDDVFGVGGTIAKISKNAKVVTAYLCDGSGGTTDKKGEERNIGINDPADKSLISVRREEAREAGKILNMQEQVFFDYPDGNLAVNSHSTKAVSDLISKFSPDIIFVPSFLDNHPDHRVTNEILVSALNICPSTSLRPDLAIWAYEVWTPIYVNKAVIINNEIETKKRAIAAHKSQLAARGYDKAIIGLNQFRAEINDHEGYAEGFFAATPEVYQKLYQQS